MVHLQQRLEQLSERLVRSELESRPEYRETNTGSCSRTYVETNSLIVVRGIRWDWSLTSTEQGEGVFTKHTTTGHTFFSWGELLQKLIEEDTSNDDS